MPTLTLTLETLATLGVARSDLIPTLTPNGRRLLQAHMVSRDFDMTGDIRIAELPSGAGFVFTQ
jgi:hypothetical protein